MNPDRPTIDYARPPETVPVAPAFHRLKMSLAAAPQLTMAALLTGYGVTGDGRYLTIAFWCFVPAVALALVMCVIGVEDVALAIRTDAEGVEVRRRAKRLLVVAALNVPAAVMLFIGFFVLLIYHGDI